jgi:hypothetical protein
VAKKIRKINKTRPSASKASHPKRKRGRNMTARLKARSTAHKTASRVARKHAQAVARAKARAAAKAAAARRAAHKTNRSHAKHHNFYCRIRTRRAALVQTASSPRQYYYRRLQMAYRAGNKAGIQSAYKGLKVAAPARAVKAAKRMKAAKAGG